MDAILTRFPQQPSHHQPGLTDLVAEANHRIANSLTLLVSMVRMQSASVRKASVPLTNAEVRLLLDGIAARINTIGQLHRLLSHSSRDGVTNLKTYLVDVTDALVAAMSSHEQEVRVKYDSSDCLVPTRQVQPMLLILCEIFINAMKYAHPASVPLVMRVECGPAPDGRLMLAVSDDGVGLPEGFDPQTAKGLGFRVMRGLAATIGAELQIESTCLGLCFRLLLPPTTAAVRSA
jgi:two-component sensor histidine kinase